MTVVSFKFLLFLLLVVAIFYLCPLKYRWIELLVASVAFYVIAGSWKFLPFIVVTSFIVWYGAKRIGILYDQQADKLKTAELDKEEKRQLKKRTKKKAKAIMLLVLVFCIGTLVITKAAKYILTYLGEAAESGVLSAAVYIIVPLGISYYTFSVVGYLLDVYWKRYEYEKNFFRFFLYAIYFPHIIEGPISRYNLLGQELKKELRFDADRVVSGMQLMMWGFFKKLVIADRLALYVNQVYDGGDHAGSIYLVAMFFDAIMIYTDFSGYMDIVSGVSQIFGVELEKNFNHPFFSRTVPEFWRRWHMTLGGWFKDYVYYPCTVSGWMKKLKKKTNGHGSQRVSRLLTLAIPIMLTWSLTGLWHGTGLNYVCWGLYYGVLITASTALEPELGKIKKTLGIHDDSKKWVLFQQIKVFVIFMGGRLLTAPGSLGNTKRVLESLVQDFQPWLLFDNSIFNYGISAKEMNLLIICFALLVGVSCLQERMKIREWLRKQNIVLRWTLMYLAIFGTMIFGVWGIGYDAASFIYMQF